MKRLILILVTSLLVVTFCTRVYGQSKIQVITNNKDSVNAYGISKFYFTHQIFADAFYLTELYKDLNYDEMKFILNSILYKLDKKNNITVIVNRPNDVQARLTFFIKENTDNGTMLAMLTNYNNKKEKFTEKIDDKNSLARWYFIKGDKLVYRKDLYSKKLEDEKKENPAYELIDFYLFDSNDENDLKVKGLIDNILNDKNSGKYDMFFAKLYLGEYYLINDDIENAEKSLLELKKYFDENVNNGISQNSRVFVLMAETEIELMKIMKD